MLWRDDFGARDSRDWFRQAWCRQCSEGKCDRGARCEPVGASLPRPWVIGAAAVQRPVKLAYLRRVIAGRAEKPRLVPYCCSLVKPRTMKVSTSAWRMAGARAFVGMPND